MIPDLKLSEHFMLSEFLHDGVDSLPNNILLNLTKLAHKLEEVRTKLGNRAITISSGYRSLEHHLEIYRQKGITDKKKIPMGSYHLKGMAADFTVAGMTAEEVRNALDPWWPGGMELGTSWVHLDMRPIKTRFYP